MTDQPLTPEQIRARGQEWYQRHLRALVNTPENLGKQLIIDVQTGDYAVDTDGVAASRRLKERHPGAVLYGLRIGYDAVYALGGVLHRIE
jgi:hypothetical protein